MGICAGKKIKHCLLSSIETKSTVYISFCSVQSLRSSTVQTSSSLFFICIFATIFLTLVFSPSRASPYSIPVFRKTIRTRESFGNHFDQFQKWSARTSISNGFMYIPFFYRTPFLWFTSLLLCVEVEFLHILPVHLFSGWTLTLV